METALTLASVPAILALVNLLKSIGLAGKWSAAAAVALAVVLNLAAYLLADSGAWQAISSGILLGLAAAGLYDITPGPRPVPGGRHSLEEGSTRA